MNIVIDKMSEVLSTAPGAVLVASNLGRMRPSGSADVPAVAVSLRLDGEGKSGLGRFVRAGDAPARSGRVVEVQATAESFSGDLRTLRISPLPLRRNPSSTAQGFTGNDLQVRNVTDISRPVVYRMEGEPGARAAFRVDVKRAEIVFGAPQTRGEILEVTHWTVAWRDEILGERYRGVMTFELWANSSAELAGMARRLQLKLSSDRAALRQKGFLQVAPAALEPIENVVHTPPVGSAFSVWRQKLQYTFAFETEEGGELSSGQPIKRIDVVIEEQFVEAFNVS
jgi:hypothetical protein